MLARGRKITIQEVTNPERNEPSVPTCGRLGGDFSERLLSELDQNSAYTESEDSGNLPSAESDLNGLEDLRGQIHDQRRTLGSSMINCL